MGTSDSGMESLLTALIGNGGSANFSMGIPDLVSLMQMLQGGRTGGAAPAGPSSVSGGNPLSGRGQTGYGAKPQDIEKLLKTLAASQQKLPEWATRAPTDTTELLRQLSGNVGQMTMPGGPTGAVTLPAWGSGEQAQVGFDPKTYGQGAGEATFFGQSTRGGMTPLSAISPLGVPQGWNPFGSATPTPKPDDKKDKKKGGGDKDKQPSAGGSQPAMSGSSGGSSFVNSIYPSRQS